MSYAPYLSSLSVGRSGLAVAIVGGCLMAASSVGAQSVASKKAPRLTYPELLRASLSGPRARLAHYGEQVAKARADEASAAKTPQLSFTAFIGPSPDIECADANCTRTSPEEATVAFSGVFGGVRLTAVQPVYTFGKLTSVSRAAKAAASAATHWKNAVAGNVAVDVARAYYGLKLARELRLMLEDGQAEIDKALVTIRTKLGKGSAEVTVQDRLRVQVLRAEVVARLTEATESEMIALAGVRALSGRVEADVDKAPLSTVAFALETSAGNYLARSRSTRPELRAAKAAAVGAKEWQRFQSAKLWPDLVAVGSVNVARAQGVDDPPSAFASDPFNTTSAALGLALRWNVDVFGQRARVRQARAKAGRAEALVMAAERTTTFELRQAHAKALMAKQRVAAAKTGYKSAKGWIASVMQAEAVGTMSAKDFADAYIAFFTLRARYLTSVYEWNLAVVGLRRALGEFSAAAGRP